MHVLALPENPVAAFVNYLLFGRPMIRRLLGATDASRAMSYARVAEAFRHKAGRTEMVPACIVGHGLDGLPRIRKLDRGGSARLLPLVMADGFAEIGPGMAMFLPMVCFAFIHLRLRSRCEGLFRGAIRCKEGAVGR